MRNDGSDGGISVPVVVAVLYLIGFATGVGALAGVIVAYAKRDDVRGSWEESHIEYLLRTFWFGLLALIVGSLLTLVGVGWLIIAAWVIWTFVRSVRSLVMATNREPVPEPETLLW